MTGQNVTVRKANDIRAFISQPAIRKQLEVAAPKHLSVDRLLRVVMTAIQKNPRLLDCSPDSILSCVMACAELGLEPTGYLGQAYLVPYKNKKTGGYQAQLIPGYRGYIALARRTGNVQSVQSQPVFANDHFVLEYGLQEKLEHRPATSKRGNFVGAYVYFKFIDGGHSFDYMTKEDIEKIRKRSQTPDAGPWVTDYNEMAKKTVIRRHAKLCPMSIEYERAVALEDRHAAGEDQADILGALDAVSAIPGELGEAEDSPGDGVQGRAQEERSAEFLKLVNEAVPLEKEWSPADGVKLKEFIADTAEIHKITPEEVQAAAIDRFPDFWGAFKRKKYPHSANVAGPPVADKGKGGTGGPAKGKDATGGAVGGAGGGDEAVSCPDLDGETVTRAFCDRECASRKGCPSFEDK